MEGNKGLNGLPDHLLLEILSLLPLKTAMATAVLSRRWRSLWTHLTDIDMDVVTLYPTYSDVYRVSTLRTLVQDVLPKLTSPFIRSISFNLAYEDHMYEGEEEYNSGSIVSLYDWASRHKNHLRKLSVLIDPNVPSMFWDTPLWIFKATSLEVLEIYPLWFGDEHDKYRNSSFHLPNLKKVSVELYCNNPWILEKLVSTSPLLEVLCCKFYLPWKNNPIIVNLSNRNLKRLEMDSNKPIQVVIDAPKLEYLSFHGKEYGYRTRLPYKISFVDSPTALLTCSISPLTDDEGRDMFLPSNLFSVISGVRSLTIPDQKPTPLIASTSFRCLTHLRFMVRSVLKELDGLEGLALLQQCPVLEVLTFDLSEYLQQTKHNWSIPDSAPQCLVTRVKRIEIIAPPFGVRLLEDMILPLLDYLLANAEVLELLKITITPPHRNVTGYNSASYDEIHLIKEVFKVPRSSPQSHVEFFTPDCIILGERGLMMLDNIRDDD